VPDERRRGQGHVAIMTAPDLVVGEIAWFLTA
jgi:hypothetical protein